MSNWGDLAQEWIKTSDRIRKKVRILKEAELAIVDLWDGQTRLALCLPTPQHGAKIIYALFSRFIIYSNIVRALEIKHPSLLQHRFKLIDARVSFPPYSAYLELGEEIIERDGTKRALRLPRDFVGAKRLQDLARSEPLAKNVRFIVRVH